MKQKYIDEKVGIFTVFGESDNGHDVNDGNRDVFTGLTIGQAEAIVAAQFEFREKLYAILAEPKKKEPVILQGFVRTPEQREPKYGSIILGAGLSVGSNIKFDHENDLLRKLTRRQFSSFEARTALNKIIWVTNNLDDLPTRQMGIVIPYYFEADDKYLRDVRDVILDLWVAAYIREEDPDRQIAGPRTGTLPGLIVQSKSHAAERDLAFNVGLNPIQGRGPGGGNVIMGAEVWIDGRLKQPHPLAKDADRANLATLYRHGILPSYR